jgi:membrane protease YdiL (CAAX protease family)
MDPTRVVPTATIVYSGLAGAGLLWSVLAGQSNPLWREGTSIALLVWGTLAGACFGGVVAVLTRMATGRVRSIRELNLWFAEVLGTLTWSRAFFLALASSVGEEIFFRGAMQPALGLVLTSVIFGLLHLPPRARFAAWTVIALVLGFGLGWLAERSANLLGPIVAHFLINFFNLKHASDLARKVAPSDPQT